METAEFMRFTIEEANAGKAAGWTLVGNLPTLGTLGTLLLVAGILVGARSCRGKARRGDSGASLTL